MRIIILGYIIRGPLGGLVWHHLQYAMGLRVLGHDVCFFEDSDDYASCYDPSTLSTSRDPSYGLRFAEDVFTKVGLEDRWVYYDAHQTRWRGPCADRVMDLCQSADLLLNVSGVNPLRPWFLEVPRRVLVDTDPVFTQLRHILDPDTKAKASKHTDFFTFGENYGQPGCGIPDDGFPWKPTRQPIVLDAWPVNPGPRQGCFTTVMQWDSYPSRKYKGIRYGMKSESFQFLGDLPSRVYETLELALGSPSAPRPMLLEKGWQLSDPLEVTKTPWSYQTYIQQSKAEFSVAKHGYMISNSGWFSERSAAYLASGRPVVTQETGFSQWMDAEGGILAFNNLGEAVAAIEEINDRYDDHCKQARAVAEKYFDSETVLAGLLEEIKSS